jgi:hypothetical protein
MKPGSLNSSVRDQAGMPSENRAKILHMSASSSAPDRPANARRIASVCTRTPSTSSRSRRAKTPTRWWTLWTNRGIDNGECRLLDTVKGRQN